LGWEDNIMPRFKNISGTRVQFTEEEETARDLEEQQALARKNPEAMTGLREKRNRLLTETDFYALSDVTMSAEMTTYRQELRDLPSGLSTVSDVENVTWPTKPTD
jgi:hypothetical protein